MKSKEVRDGFLDFFRRNGHKVVSSAPLVPKGDDTLLFTSAGMVQFKLNFLGVKKDLSRAASCQKSFRMTDIEKVGLTARHLTFFEMLGNFSFGDYFKEEAVAWSWEFLTKIAGLDPERLYITIYGGGLAPKDDEAATIWKKVLPAKFHNKIKQLGDSDNFWTMGPTGPCGPCSEVYYDFSPDKDVHKNCAGVGCNCDRYIEIWNLVFTQFDRAEDGSLKLLPRKNIDTGMGLERICAAVQGKTGAFETDLFAPLMKKAGELVPVKNGGDTSLKIISDHARGCAFLIGEGITPSNEGRGYVLRRIIRRAVRQGMLEGAKDAFLYNLTDACADIFAQIYPEIKDNSAEIKRTIKQEEERFLQTVSDGEKRLTALMSASSSVINGKEVFDLYQTYGFPVELTREAALKGGKTIDEKGFGEAQKKAQEIARSKWAGSGEKGAQWMDKAGSFETTFTGYEALSAETEIIALFNDDGEKMSEIKKGETGFAVLKQTPFYAEGGGQTGDIGVFTDGKNVLAEITDTQKSGKTVFHKLKSKTNIKTGQKITASVDTETRKSAQSNHTATHLLNYALRKVLGTGVRQAGSFVSPAGLRFDYTAPSAPTSGQIAEIEKIVNSAVKDGFAVNCMTRPAKDAEKLGATTLLGENYGENPRFVLINPSGWNNTADKISLELCGGTHAKNTGELIGFKIIKDFAVSSGVRRIEAAAGRAFIGYLSELAGYAERTAKILLSPACEIEERAKKLLEREKTLRKEMQELKEKLAGGASVKTNSMPVADGVSLVWTVLDSAGASILRNTADNLRNAGKNSVVFAMDKNGDKMSLIVCLGDGLKTTALDASKIAKTALAKLGGTAGGRKDFAQGGARLPDNLDQFLKDCAEEIKNGK